MGVPPGQAEESGVAKAQAVEPIEQPADLKQFQDVVLLAVPASYYRTLQNEALRRGMPLTNLLRTAIKRYLEETEPKE